MSNKGEEVALRLDLAAVGVNLKSIHDPRTEGSLVAVIIPAGTATELEVAATAASLLMSVVQNFTVEIVGAEHSLTKVCSWLAPDNRFIRVAADDRSPSAAEFTLVLPAGTMLGAYSLEALIDAAQDTGATLIRALVDGRKAAVELWVSAVLTEAELAGDPEKWVRAAGGERWVSGNSLGLHDYRKPVPRMHLRKGAAASHELTIVVRDTTDSRVRDDYENRIRQLDAKLSRSQSAVRRLEAGIAPKRGAVRLSAVAKRGSVYVAHRIRKFFGRATGQ